MAATNLPARDIQDSASATKLFFDVYGQLPLEFSSNEVDATIGFFTSSGFSTDSAIIISASLLKQAKLDEVPIFRILDTIKKLDKLELSALVGEILNNNRGATSTLGFRVTKVDKQTQTRNIVA